jgi:hypothetical protein
MKIIAVILLTVALLAFAGERRITGEVEAVQRGGSSVHLVTVLPPVLDLASLNVGTPAAFEPPSEYQALETILCRFVVPDKAGIFPVTADLFAESLELNPLIELTDQAQQAVDIAPDWLQQHLIWKLSMLTSANQDRYATLLLAHQGQPWYDELAFTVAYLSWTILSVPNWDETVLVENAQGIYENVQHLSYVNVNDYGGPGYYSTTEYHTIQGSDTVWVEIPMDIYYHHVVMPKLSDERPLNDETVYDEFWRTYLFDFDDPPYPVLNQVLNPNVLVFWDEQTKNYGWSTTPEFSDSLHAVDIISKWTRAMIPDPPSGPRPIQPNQIVNIHRGYCGETQDLLSAAARVALIPVRATMNINEDHVWCELWWDGMWRGWYVDTVNNQNVAYDYTHGGSKDVSCVWSWRNDGYTWDRADYYTDHCTFTVTVTDSMGKPVDNATVQIASEGWQTSTIYRGTWGQTDRNGQITFVLGDNQNYYLNIASPLGNFGGSSYEEMIVNSVAGQDYHFEWTTPLQVPELEVTELPGGVWTKYLIQVNYSLPYDIMNGRDYYASPRSEYGEPLPDGTADFFLVDSENLALYQEGEPFQCYELIEGQNTGEVWFYAPHTDNWHIVFSGDRHVGVQTFAEAEVTLWRHDGTGIEGGLLNATAVVHPNPCTASASVRFTTASPGMVSLTVYDIQGRLVHTGFNDILQQGAHSVDLDTSRLSSGLYFVKITSEGGSTMRSLTVLR